MAPRWYLVFAILGEGYEKHLLKIDMKHYILFISFPIIIFKSGGNPTTYIVVC